MATDKKTDILSFLSRNKPALLVLALGVLFMLLSSGTLRTEEGQGGYGEETSESERLALILGKIEGAGETYVLLPERGDRDEPYSGCVVVCAGAERAEVRLHIVQAVTAATDLGSDRIVVLKLKP